MPLSTDKEALYAALLNRMTKVTGVKTISRKVRHYDEVPSVEQPALFVEQTLVDIQTRPNGPGRQVVKANIILYAFDETSDGPMSQINGLVGQVESLMKRQVEEPAPSQTTTLGGLVQSASIVSIEFSGGNVGNQGVAIIGIELLTST